MQLLTLSPHPAAESVQHLCRRFVIVPRCRALSFGGAQVRLITAPRYRFVIAPDVSVSCRCCSTQWPLHLNAPACRRVLVPSTAARKPPQPPITAKVGTMLDSFDAVCKRWLACRPWWYTQSKRSAMSASVRLYDRTVTFEINDLRPVGMVSEASTPGQLE